MGISCSESGEYRTCEQGSQNPEVKKGSLKMEQKKDAKWKSKTEPRISRIISLDCWLGMSFLEILEIMIFCNWAIQIPTMKVSAAGQTLSW